MAAGWTDVLFGPCPHAAAAMESPHVAAETGSAKSEPLPKQKNYSWRRIFDIDVSVCELCREPRPYHRSYRGSCSRRKDSTLPAPALQTAADCGSPSGIRGWFAS